MVIDSGHSKVRSTELVSEGASQYSVTEEKEACNGAHISDEERSLVILENLEPMP